MKQTLGKIFFLILFLSIEIFADVTASVNAPAIYRGDMVNYTILAEGNSIEFPNISDIGGYTIRGSSSSQSVQIINGQMSKTISKTYNFSPKKSVTIPSYTLTIDGKELKTKEIKVEVVKPQASQNGSPFVLEMYVNKNESYVGEMINLTLTFKRKLNTHVEQLELGEPKLENFWVKKIEGSKKGQKGEYIYETISYKLFPQKAGEYKIPSLSILIGQQSRRRAGGFFNDPFFAQQLTWQKIYSNELKIKVNALPNGIELYGNYLITASVDKKSVKLNKPINLTINIKGEGNIDDVKKFDIDINGVIIYPDEPKISSELVHNIYQGEFNQKIALIADRNFTIPSLSLEYFDKKTKKLKTITTKPIDIEVEGGSTQPHTTTSMIEVSPTHLIHTQPTVQTKTEIIKLVKEDAYLKYLFLALGFILGLGLAYGINHFKIKNSRGKNDIVKAIHRAKNDKVLFDLLLPYAKKDVIISQALNKLEKNIYHNGEEKIDKEEIMEVFEKN